MGLTFYSLGSFCLLLKQTSPDAALLSYEEVGQIYSDPLTPFSTLCLLSRKEYSRFWGESIVSPFSFLFSLFRDTVFLTLTPQLTDWSSDCRRGWLVSGLVSPASSAFGFCCLAHLSCPPPPLGIRAASSS